MSAPSNGQVATGLQHFQGEIYALAVKARELEIDIEKKEKANEEGHEQLEREKQEFQSEMKTERDKLKKEEDQHQQKMGWDREALRKEQEHFKEAQNRGAEIVDAQEPVTVEVGGEKFRTELRTLAKCEGSVFPALVRTLQRKNKDGKNKRDPYIFIDRDGRHFRFILNYLRQGKQVMRWSAMRNADTYTLSEILAEVQYYKIPELERLIRLKMTSLEKVVNFDTLMKANYFRAVQTTTSQVKYITLTNITIKNVNLSGILFDKVQFNHPVMFEHCVLTAAKFNRCHFKNALNFTGVDLHRALFDHCEGVNIARGFVFQDTDYSLQDLFQPPLSS